jgi:Holliday junction resolvase RusA-like endonuclease
MILELRFNMLPPALNEQIDLARSDWRASAAVKKTWTNKVADLTQTVNFSFDDKVWLEYHWHLKTFARDSDNVSAASKYILDGLVDAGIIRNDNLIVIQSPVPHYYYRAKSDGVILRLSSAPDFLLENFCKSTQLGFK